MLNLMKQNRSFFKVVGLIALVGVFCGILYYSFLSDSIKENIANTIINYNSFRYNSILKDLIVTSLILVTSFFVLGIPISIFYLFYEFLSLGFMLSIFFVNFNLSGIFYFLIFFIINKLVVIILLILFIKKTINISRYIVGLVIYKRDSIIKNNLVINLTNSIYLIIFILIINILIYFVSPSIFSHLSFLLK